MTRAGAALGIVLLLASLTQRTRVETLRSIGGLAAHVAGRFEDIGACEPASSGDFLVFDRRAHMVSAVPASMDGGAARIGRRRRRARAGAQPERLRPSPRSHVRPGRHAIRAAARAVLLRERRSDWRIRAAEKHGAAGHCAQYVHQSHRVGPLYRPNPSSSVSLRRATSSRSTRSTDASCVRSASSGQRARKPTATSTSR